MNPLLHYCRAFLGPGDADCLSWRHFCQVWNLCCTADIHILMEQGFLSLHCVRLCRSLEHKVSCSLTPDNSGNHSWIEGYLGLKVLFYDCQNYLSIYLYHICILIDSYHCKFPNLWWHHCFCSPSDPSEVFQGPVVKLSFDCWENMSQGFLGDYRLGNSHFHLLIWPQEDNFEEEVGILFVYRL